MHLRKHDLLQMDGEWLKKLPAELLLEVSKRLLHDVTGLQDRLNQNPTNSSRPQASRAPWEKARDAAGEKGDASVENSPQAAAETAPDAADSTAETVKANVKSSASPKAASEPRGKQPGSPEHGRTQKLMIINTCEHRPERCTACGPALFAHHQPRNPLRSRFPRLCSAEGRHRNLPSSRRLCLAISRCRHLCCPYRFATPRSSHPGSGVGK